MGSNDIGLDRGQIGQQRLVRFTRTVNKVLPVQRNLEFRASTADLIERPTVEDSFAVSAIAGFTVEAEEGGRVLINATEFFLSDGRDVIGTLKETQQGAFMLDPKRSVFVPGRKKSFPRNTEVEVMLTFAGAEPGQFGRDNLGGT